MANRKSTYPYHLFFNLTPDLYCFANFNGYFIELNDNWSKLLGWKTKELLAKPFLDFVHPDDKQRTIDVLEKIQNGEQVTHFENRYRSKDGRWIWLDWSGYPLKDESLILAVARDITALHQANDDLQKERIKIVQSATFFSLGQMAAGISHEVNNPLAVIKGLVSLIRAELRKTKSGYTGFHRQLEKIDEMIARISKIVRGLRALVRSAPNDPFEGCSLREIIDMSVELCQQRFKAGKVRLVIGKIPDVVFKAREAMLSQVVSNLLNNAFDAVNGTDDAWVRIDGHSHRGNIQIKVEDSGRIQSSDLKTKLFEPFFTTKGPGDGLGLGLNLSRAIIEDHGGKIWLDEKALHTTFVFEIPKHLN